MQAGVTVLDRPRQPGRSVARAADARL